LRINLTRAMTKRLKFMTPVKCSCGARGDMVWSEEETDQSDRSQNYQAVSVTELFALSGNTLICRLCDRETPCPGSKTEPPATRST
jgi:hypothetical protein